MRRLIKLLSSLTDLIYKKKCYICSSKRDNSKLCSKCYDSIDFIGFNPLKIIDGVKAYSATVYTKNMQKLIRGIKYHNQYELAPFQARKMYDYWNNSGNLKTNYVIVPVPLYKNREKHRKYNQMMLVAEEFSRLTGYPIKKDLIKRIKDTKPQYKLHLHEREKNLANAFEVDPTKYNGENLLIIDDILTTGSTLGEMIRTFRRENINHLTCFTTSCAESYSTFVQT